MDMTEETTVPKTTTRPTAAPAADLPDQGPDIARFLVTLAPDPELDRLASAYAEAAERAADLRRHAAELDRRRATLADALAEATPSERGALWPAIAGAAAEAGSLPSLLADAARRLALAELGYLRRVRRLARAEAKRLADELAPTVAALEEVARKERFDDARHAAGPIYTEAERQAMRAERSKLWQASALLRQAFQQADLVVQLTTARGHRYGDDVRLDPPSGWERAAARAAEAARRAARGEAMAA